MSEEKRYASELAAAKETRTLPREIEAKVVINDIQEFQELISRAGGTLERGRTRLTDTYYGLGEKRADFRGFLTTPLRVDSVGDYGKLDQALSYLGVRVKEHLQDRRGELYLIERPVRIEPRHIRFRENDTGELTLTVKAKREKGGVGKIDQRVEIEIPVVDAADVISFLEAIGYKKGKTEVKERITHRLGNALVEINTLPQHGNVIYAEIEAPTKEELFAAAKKLGVEPQQLISMSTKDFLVHIGHEPQSSV